MVLDGEEPAPRRRAVRADAQRNRDLLLRSAHEAFGERGVDASLDDVARRAGLGAGTLYRHFPGREALIEALLRDRLEQLRQRAVELLDDDRPLRAVQTWMLECARGASIYRGAPAAVVRLMQEPGSELYESCHAMTAAAHALLTHAAERGAIREQPHDDILALVGGAAWVSENAPDGDRLPRLIQLIADALTPRRAEPGSTDHHGR